MAALSAAMQMAAEREAARAGRSPLAASIEELVENAVGAFAIGVGCGLGLASSSDGPGEAVGWTVGGVGIGLAGAVATFALAGRLKA